MGNMMPKMPKSEPKPPPTKAEDGKFYNEKDKEVNPKGERLYGLEDVKQTFEPITVPLEKAGSAVAAPFKKVGSMGKDLAKGGMEKASEGAKAVGDGAKAGVDKVAEAGDAAKADEEKADREAIQASASPAIRAESCYHMARAFHAPCRYF